jgi:hypothetical protein
MAYSKKVVEKFENTLNNPRLSMLEDLIPKETYWNRNGWGTSMW